jgi:hypothetical protein
VRSRSSVSRSAGFPHLPPTLRSGAAGNPLPKGEAEKVWHRGHRYRARRRRSCQRHSSESLSATALHHKTKVSSFRTSGDSSLGYTKQCRSKDVFNTFGRLAICVALTRLCACDALVGPESRELAGGYRLKRVAGSSEFALIIPHESGGLIIDEIGWRKPLIVARATGSKYWDVINTARAEHTRISDQALQSDSMYQSIQVVAAGIAWNNLNRRKRIW